MERLCQCVCTNEKTGKKLTRSIIKRVGETNHIPSQNGLNHHWVDTKKEEMSAYILVFLVNKFHPHLLSLTSILHFLLCICLNIIENFCTFLYQSLSVNISLFSTIFFYYIKTVYGLISNYWFSGIKKKISGRRNLLFLYIRIITCIYKVIFLLGYLKHGGSFELDVNQETRSHNPHHQLHVWNNCY